jgi:diguanylate cyclase (GGDEF)-like protein
MRACVRDGDVLARYGGDEFIILSPAGADGLSGRIERAFDEPFDVAGEPAAVGVSVGVGVGVGVVRATPDMDADTVLRRADDAMYAAKSRRKASDELSGSAEYAVDAISPPAATIMISRGR